MKWILLIALWTDRGLDARAYEYAERSICEQVAASLYDQAETLPDRQPLKISCSPVQPFAETEQ